MDKFISPEKAPEGLDRELITILAEECAEIAQRASKSLRFGVREIQPGQPLTNDERMAGEVGDLLGVIDALQERGLCPQMAIDAGRETKREKLQRFLQST